jgi:hypothetical protein
MGKKKLPTLDFEVGVAGVWGLPSDAWVVSELALEPKGKQSFEVCAHVAVGARLDRGSTVVTRN